MNADTQRALDWLLAEPDARQHARIQGGGTVERAGTIRRLAEMVPDHLKGVDFEQVDWIALVLATL